MEPDDIGEIALHVDGASAIAVGDPVALAALFERLDIDPVGAVPVGQAIVDSVAAVSGMAAIRMTTSGNWFQMTAESLANFKELSQFNPATDGVFSAVFRGSGGRFQAVADLVQTTGINPTSVANFHALSSAIALRMALKKLENLVKTLDVKLDRLLQDARTQEMGNVQGITHVLSKSYAMFEETGKVTTTSWDQVTTHATELAQSHAVALQHIETLAQGLSAGSFKTRLNGAEFAAAGELQHWLVLTAVCLANMARMDALELAHATAHDDEGSATSQAAQIKKASDERWAKTKEKVQTLAEAVASAGRVDALTRVRSPLAAARNEKALEQIQSLLTVFSDALGMTSGSVPIARRAWHGSVKDLAEEVGDGVMGAARTVASGVASAPKMIGTAVEDSVLGLAQTIQSRRESEGQEASSEREVALQPEAEASS
ncbi:hypothetical protein [Mycetocola zhujimingii]|nr:hypothetical protein [Mycetocola zhujimingii]